MAQALRERDAQVLFVCRATPGNSIGLIEAHGFRAEQLTQDDTEASTSPWLAVSQETDARQTVALLDKFHPDLTIVDHYGLDYRWHDIVQPHTGHVMVIDDLADRHHHCDLLLDQTYGREQNDYATLVPATTRLLVGSR